MDCVVTFETCRSRLAGTIAPHGLTIRRLHVPGARLSRRRRAAPLIRRECALELLISEPRLDPANEGIVLSRRVDARTDLEPVPVVARWGELLLFRGALARIRVEVAGDALLRLTLRLVDTIVPNPAGAPDHEPPRPPGAPASPTPAVTCDAAPRLPRLGSPDQPAAHPFRA